MIQSVDNVEAELDALKVQMTELHALVRQLSVSNPTPTANPALNRVAAHPIQTEVPQESIDQGGVYFSGQYQGAFSQYRWEPQERRI
ncbi:hypothetical protein [Paenibacillus terrigena]|uniref:hypothetical protein n=1 Tax=Paenibacillus terrigena TaxID=369333 RepID=UPI0028D7E864|nr:hypothetical protein [Paenibacillus terrigena]